MPRDMSSPAIVFKVLDGLIEALRAEHVDIITTDQLERVVGTLKARVTATGANAVRL